MDFSKLAAICTAICAGGLLLGADKLAGAENILRFRVPGQQAAAPPKSSETSPKQPLITVRFLSPSPAAVPDSPLDAAAAEPPLVNPLHLRELPPAPGYSGPGHPTGWFAWDNPWRTYAEDMWLAHVRRQERQGRPWLWWLDSKGGLLDLLGIFKRNASGCCCSQQLAATTPDIPDPAAMPEPAVQPPRNTVPQRSVPPRNQIPQSSRREPAKPMAHARKQIDHRR